MMEQDIVINIIELLGTFAFAISGIRHAAAKQFDWFGGYVCGIAVAIGGGTIRDVMLGTIPFWMTTPIYLICTAVALLTVAFFIYTFYRHTGKPFGNISGVVNKYHNTFKNLKEIELDTIVENSLKKE